MIFVNSDELARLFHLFYVTLHRFTHYKEQRYRNRQIMNINFDNIFGEQFGQNTISVITDIDATKSNIIDLELGDDELPILPLRTMMLFPGTLLPVNIGRKSSLRLLNDAQKRHLIIGVFSQTDDNVSDPENAEVYRLGCAAKVMKILELPDGSKTALLQGYCRIELIDCHFNGDYIVGHVKKNPEHIPAANDREFNALVEAVRDIAEKYLRLGEMPGFDAGFSLRGLPNKTFLVNFICANLPIDNKERIELLEKSDMKARAERLLELLHREYQFATLKANIHMRTHEELNKQQREVFLQQEMRNIQEELGEGSANDVDKLKEASKKKKWSEETQKLFDKELLKLKRISSAHPDYQTQYDYLNTLLQLPWNEMSRDNINLNTAERQLNHDHYGMEKVKERILEHLAVVKTRGDFKSPIICLYGPPGVGKTSLGKSIAKAMKRKYVRISLGGLHDESEIRGHRRTYIGAMPGRIIKSIQQAGTSNPVFILDEIDKIGQMSNHGDPSSALLEVLDPEQNAAFHDNFIDCDYDLSHVMFIATANNISTIPAPLLDRMELIEVSGYLTEEKIEIARRHLIPDELDKLGMKDSGIKISKSAIEKIIEDYTRESGVRELDKKLNKLLRKLTLQYARSEQLPDHELNKKDIVDLLGPELFSRDKYQGNEYAGVVTGLAWTSVGGEILFIEASLSRGKQQKLTLTGNLGDVMKESAVLALEYLKAHADKYDIDARIFEEWNIHIHVPEGAVPKDGPSAGITITTSLASALTQRKVRQNLAMTGEMTLRGKVLPVGGIKEKILAAKRAGITDIMLSEENEKDILQIPEKYVKGVTFHYVKDAEDVLRFALLDEKVAHPIEFKFDDNKEEEK